MLDTCARRISGFPPTAAVSSSNVDVPVALAADRSNWHVYVLHTATICNFGTDGSQAGYEQVAACINSSPDTKAPAFALIISTQETRYEPLWAYMR